MSQADRHVAVYARPAAGGAWSTGSGYHLGGSLVLTSRHVVRAKDGSPRENVLIHLRGAAALLGCEVVWCGADEVDAALLRVVAPGAELPVRRQPVRWGRFATSAPGQPCHAVGFPAYEGRGPAHELVASQVTGRINPLTGVDAERLSVDVDSAPVELTGDRSLWEGMSGAAVVCGGAVVGVVRHDAAHFASRRLAAVPVERCAADPEFRRLVAEVCDGEPVLRPVDLDTLFTEVQPLSSPATLLVARSHTVGFRGRDAELARLREWCARDEGFSAHIVTGPGGQGKTRLAARLADELAAAGWVAGFVTGDLDREAAAGLAALRRPALLVVDYAETSAGTIRALTEATRRTETAVRLLLLARSAGEWRDDSAVEHYLEYLVHAPVLQLEALERTTHGRLDAWREAVSSLARALSRFRGYEGAGAHADAVAAAPPRSLTEEQGDGGPILGIHIDALAALLAATEPDKTGSSPVDTLLRHEERYWKWLAGARQFTAEKHTLASAVAMATLFGAATEHDALALVAALPGLPEDRRHTAVRWLADALPGSGGHWGALQPDRLGEHHVARVLHVRPELATALVRVASPAQVEHALTVLTRAAVDARHLDPVIGAVVAAAPRVTGPAALSVAVRSENPAPLLASLEQVVASADTGLLAALAAAIPVRTQVLNDIAIKVLERLAAAYEAAPDADALARPRALAQLARRLRNRGRFEDAVRVNEQAIELFDRLVDPADSTHLVDLGNALDGLADQLSRLHRLPESLAVSKGGVATARRAATADPAAQAHLAGALNGFATRLGLAGRHREAARVAQQAVDINRELVRAPGGEAQRPGLATSLNILGVQRGLDGRRGEALAAIEEALGIRRELAKAEPDAYGVQLASSLNNLSNQYRRREDTEKGLRASEEAVAILRRLAEANPEAHDQDLAMALGNLTRRLSELGRTGPAAAAGRELVRVFRALVRARPEQHRAGLATALMTAAQCLVAHGAVDEAGDFAADAAALHRELGEPHALALARSLQLRAEWLDSLRRGEEALASMEECVTVHRGLAAHDGGEKLSGALLHLAGFLVRAGLGERAGAAAQEAVDLRRALAADGLPQRRSDLAAALVQHADLLDGLGRTEESLPALSEAVDIRRSLNAGARLAGLLRHYADQLMRMGRYWDARNTLLEAIRGHRRLRALRHRRTLAVLHRNLARAYVGMHRPDEAAEAVADAVATLRPLAGRSEHDAQELALALEELARLHDLLGRPAEAARARAELEEVRGRSGAGRPEVP
ncbi:trypsin-like peptidase domain-containing protein [Saccharothrix algeriensis]|uniref:Trypsin-like peptidase domain-containing protein n=1 Tax=Saccharothrix algeriensis TaxID=173560 RepID=A0A8T8I1C9_9PSEU|nr:trypsin-like peptidase domain-containing protein [Saccharothrix algeriensis]